jgi:hypothetical protein
MPQNLVFRGNAGVGFNLEYESLSPIENSRPSVYFVVVLCCCYYVSVAFRFMPAMLLCI